MGAALFPRRCDDYAGAVGLVGCVEGLKLVTPTLSAYIVPISVADPGAAVRHPVRMAPAQWRVFFGPITALWFIVMGVAGIMHISDDFGILAAFNPWYAINFLLNEGIFGVVVLGAVFLTVTGAEALTPTSAILAGGRSSGPGSPWCFRR